MKTSGQSLIPIFVTIFAVSNPAFACGGGKNTTYNVKFATDSSAPDALAITLTDPSTGQANQYLDDDGYLSAHVGISYLYKSSLNSDGLPGRVSLTDNESTVQFIKNRLDIHKKSIEKMDLDQFQIDEWTAPIDKFNQLISASGTVDANEL